MKKWATLAFAASILTFAGCSNGQTEQQETTNQTEEQNIQQSSEQTEASAVAEGLYTPSTDGTIDHIHGIGFTGNVPGLTFASHNGLKVYHDGEWLETTEQNNDYMGFQATNTGFFASGHPGEKSELKNPLGLVKSDDGGKTITPLAFYEQSDFHFMAVGYNSHAVYVYNEQANSQIEEGFHYSTDEGKTWTKSELNGLSNAGMFAAHPDRDSVVAMSTKEGIYLSTDYGNHFQPLSESVETTAVTLSNETMIYAYTKDGEQGLRRQSLAIDEVTELSIPDLAAKDFILYVAQQPNEKTIAFATAKGNAYMSDDKGKTWKHILKEGVPQQ